MKILAIVCFLVALFMVGPVAAQTGKVGVYFRVTSEGATGQQIVFQFRDKVRGSATFEEVGKEADGLFVVEFVTLESSSNNDGLSTIYAFTFLYENNNGSNYYDTQYVGYVVARS